MLIQCPLCGSSQESSDGKLIDGYSTCLYCGYSAQAPKMMNTIMITDQAMSRVLDFQVRRWADSDIVSETPVFMGHSKSAVIKLQVKDEE